jgi:uncharacterized LabA/DUF88 family protein/chemotaxis protein histidine kinase CheA
MNNSNEARLKIAVFIDVDNISIGVKQSMNRNFDVGAVLEAIKEKGEIITKIAYGDWKRADDFSRAMTHHAIQMVQRNATPGGDKNGADIALALDALETAFTRPHINAFVIVGGDSDFIALVEKLKQYDKTVFVVGGRGFTSIILQKNCHEFISYENLVGVHTSRKLTGRIQLSSPSTLESTMPLVRRALKILSDREVSPQLGLLKSTLLQLDSTFSERDYGVSSFRDFVQKLADAGYIYLKQVDRSILVELKESFKEQERTDDAADSENEPTETIQAYAQEPVAAPAETLPEPAEPAEAPAPASNDADAPAPLHAADASAALEELLRNSASKPHWPLYLRTFKQLLRAQQPPFDERQYGISSTYDLARQAQRDGLFHIERNRQGILRIFPGERFPKHVQETEEAAAPVTPEIPGGETACHVDVSEEVKESSAAAPVASEEAVAVKAAAETTPELAANPELSVPGQAETVEKAAETEDAAPKDETASIKPKTKPRTQRKPATAAKTSKPAQSAQKSTPRKTQATAKGTKGKTKKKEE